MTNEKKVKFTVKKINGKKHLYIRDSIYLNKNEIIHKYKSLGRVSRSFNIVKTGQLLKNLELSNNRMEHALDLFLKHAITSSGIIKNNVSTQQCQKIISENIRHSMSWAQDRKSSKNLAM